jgi:hypothetical protein
VPAVVHGLMVAVPAAVGLAVLRRRPGGRFARLLVATYQCLWPSRRGRRVRTCPATGRQSIRLSHKATWTSRIAPRNAPRLALRLRPRRL